MTETQTTMTGDDRIAFRFTGDGSGRTPLSWGQRSIWQAIQWLGDQRHYFNIRRTVPVAGLDPDQVVGVLRTLVERHQGLRTHFLESPQGPLQEVHDTGEQLVAVHRAADPAEAAAVAERALADDGGRPFGPGQWPWRCALVVVDGTVAYLNVVLDHQTADGFGAGLLMDELRGLLAGDPAAAAGAAWQPLDQAGYEATGEGARRGALSMGYWERQLATVPPTMFDLPAREPDDPPFWKIGISSPAAAVAATRIAARTNKTTSAVLLAAGCLVLSRLTGHATCVLQLIVANRFDEHRRSLVSAMYEDGLFVLDLAGAGGFDEVVERTFRAALATYRYGFYDRVERDALIRRLEAERGTPIRLSSYFNDARFGDAWTGLPEVADPEQLARLTERTELDVVGSWERQDSTFFLAANEAPGSCRLTLLSDTRYLTVPETRQTLRAIESVLVAAAFGDVPVDLALPADGLAAIPRPAPATA